MPTNTDGILQGILIKKINYMWVRHKCNICNGTGKIKKENCNCLVLPDYLKIFPNGEWQNTTIGWNATPAKCLVYACGDDGCIIINDWSDVTISGLGTLPEAMTPRTVEELNNLCLALKLKIVC